MFGGPEEAPLTTEELRLRALTEQYREAEEYQDVATATGLAPVSHYSPNLDLGPTAHCHGRRSEDGNVYLRKRKGNPVLMQA